jgi:AraC-like DNA-binding protein
MVISFRQELYEKWLQDFAFQLNSPLKDNLLVLPPQIGKGTIFAHDVSPGISYLIMDFQLEEELEIRRQPGGLKGFALSFNQVEKKDDKRPFRNDIFLSDTRHELSLTLAAGSIVKRLIVFYSDEIAASYLDASILTRLEVFARENALAPNKHLISFTHRETLKDIFDMKENDQLSQLKCVTHVIYLTEKFLHSFLRGQTPANKVLKKNDLESLQYIERILCNNKGLEGFPSLESLANEVFMSTSKLKNLFKQVYGFTLYDYYNKNRLNRAKEMLLTGQYSVKHAGSEIGFSNLSHFAKAFKKEFGALPREVVKGR